MEVGEDRPLRFLTGAIELDEQTDEILAEPGLNWEPVIELHVAGAVL